MASPPIVEDSDITARRAKMRIAVAVVLLAIAIGGLALLSRHKPEQQPADEAATPSGKQESISSGPNNAEAPPQINSAQQEPPPAPPTPETPAEPATEPPPPPPPPAPVVSKLPPEPAHSTAPATAASVTGEKTSKAEKPAPAPVPQKNEQPQEKPSQQQANEKPVPTPAPAPQKTEPKSYEVQVGVFSDMENAKQLQAKLTEHGIPSHTETKLQIGPFATKAEADAAQAKLKALGMGAVIVPGK